MTLQGKTTSPMTATPDIAELVQAAMLKAAARKNPLPGSWQRRSKIIPGSASCSFCQADLSNAPPRTVQLTWIVPPLHGGATMDENLAVLCQSCTLSRSTLDLLAWPTFASVPHSTRTDMLIRRLKYLTVATNHLTPHSPHADRKAIVRHLENRFTHPRFRCFAIASAGGCFIGWPTQDLAGPAAELMAALLRYQAQATPCPSEKLTLFQVPSPAFLDTIWELIERNALVEKLDVPELGAALPEDHSDWRTYWHRTFASLVDLHHRRSAIHPQAAPWPMRVLSDKRSARSRRKTRAAKKKEGDRREYLMAEHALRARIDRLLSGEQTGDSAMEVQAEMRRVLTMKLRVLGCDPEAATSRAALP